MSLRTCKHIYDTGGTCNSAAAVDRDYCIYHLGYRVRQLRMAQRRARNERFDFKLPPLENMFAVHSALNQIAEAVAADMLDLKRARLLLSVVRAAGQFLMHPEKWQANPYHTDVAAPAIDLAAEYGLPADLDVDTPPEVAFPSSEEPAVADTNNWPLTTDNSNLSPIPTVDYCEHGPGCPEHTIRADYPETAELAELREVYEHQGADAAGACHKRQQQNRQRRYFNTERKRYAAIALEKNLRLAAERLAERKLAERTTEAKTETSGSDTSPKKPASFADEWAALAAKEAESIA